MILCSLSLSSVLGITQNETLRIAGAAYAEVGKNASAQPLSKVVYHVTDLEKERFLYENEEEDNKEKTFYDPSVPDKRAFVPYTGRCGLSAGVNAAHTVSRNVLYCVFLI